MEHALVPEYFDRSPKSGGFVYGMLQNAREYGIKVQSDFFKNVSLTHVFFGFIVYHTWISCKWNFNSLMS